MIINFIKQNKLIIVLVLVYFFVFSVLTCLRHYTFQTQAWDLAAYDQTFWNSVNGKFMWNIFEGASHFAVHFSPILILLLPFYFIWQSPYNLLILQSLILALGALPLYLLAKDLIDKKWAIVSSIIYLIYPSLNWVNFYDFHPVALGIPLILSAFYFINKNNYLWSSIFLILTAGVEENMIVAVFFIGIYLLLIKKWKYGLAVSFLSLIYFILVAKALMPAFGGGIVRLDRYAQFGGSLTEIAKNLILNPGLTFTTIFQPVKGIYLLKILLSAAFLPLAAWPALILLIPGLLQNLLTSELSQFSNFYQYDAILIPFILISAIYGIKKLMAINLPKKTLLWLISILIATGFIWNSPLSPLNFPLPKFTSERTSVFQKIIKTIPTQASVAAHTNLVPHLSHREYIYLAGTEPFLVDYVILDGNDLFAFPSQESLDNYLDKYRQAGEHEIIIIDDRYFILKKITD